MKICPTCQTEYDDVKKYCRADGAALAAKEPAGNGTDVEEPLCSRCGRTVTIGHNFCGHCGAALLPEMHGLGTGRQNPGSRVRRKISRGMSLGVVIALVLLGLGLGYRTLRSSPTIPESPEITEGTSKSDLSSLQSSRAPLVAETEGNLETTDAREDGNEQASAMLPPNETQGEGGGDSAQTPGLSSVPFAFIGEEKTGTLSQEMDPRASSPAASEGASGPAGLANTEHAKEVQAVPEVDEGQPQRQANVAPKRKESKTPLGLYRVVVATSLRSEPSPYAPVVRQLSKGLKVHVIGQSGTYLQVQSRRGRTPGYVHRDDVTYLRKD